METILEEFGLFSLELQLSSSVTEKAKLFVQDVSPAYVQCGQKISRKALFACAIFIVVQDKNYPADSKLDEQSTQPEITVTQLLEKADINIMDFFSVTCFLKTNYPLSDNIKQNLIALERKYLIVSALYDKFESMTDEVFYGDSEVSLKTSPNSFIRQGSEINRLLKDHKALCWMLFLVAKAKILWHRQELLATFHLLLCCIGEVIRTTPSFLLFPPFDGISAKNANPLAILEVLSNHFKTRFEEVKAVYDGWLHVASELKVESKLPEVQDLHSIYDQLYRQTGDVNESLFLNRDWHLLPSNSEQTVSPRKNPPASVRRTLDTAEALNTILLSPPDSLNQSLQLSLQKCLIDASSIIQNFLAESKEKFLLEFVAAHESSDRSLAERRFRLASRYYYIMLDSLLKKEAVRLGRHEFTSFIQNTVFHKSLLACCIEVTLMSCGSVGPVNFTPVPYGGRSQAQGIIFPWILQVFDLEAFHFFKIIESFIRGAPSITMQIINHLKSIEDKILDSLAWKSGSSVFEGITSSGCSLNCKAKYGSPRQSPNFWSPNKDVTQRSPGTPHTCHAVNLFLNKACRLAYQRLEKLCNLLDIEQKLQSDIWICIEHLLYKKTHLLLDRHLDQIIMCCIFAVCKACEQEVRFKAITACYERLDHSSTSVYKHVMTGGKKDYIIKFYNREFHDEMESYIVSSFGRKSETSSTSISASPSPAVSSPFYSLPNKKNIFISPLQQSPFKNPNEVIRRTVGSYTFGSLTQSSKKLQDINGCLNMLMKNKDKEVIARGKKRLQFDSEEADQKEVVNSARKFLKFDQPDSSVSFQKPKSSDSGLKN